MEAQKLNTDEIKAAALAHAKSELGDEQFEKNPAARQAIAYNFEEGVTWAELRHLSKQSEILGHVSDALIMLFAIKSEDPDYDKIEPVNISLLKALGRYDGKEEGE